MMSLLGGVQTFFGPILGSIVYWELQNNLSQGLTLGPLTLDGKYWEGYIGVVFVAFVLAGPRGIMGLIDAVRQYGIAGVFSRARREEPLTPRTPGGKLEERPGVDDVGAGRIPE
jgi:hypothetical protein